ncbi:MAG TPA: MBOAT family O-acyltransferase [Verrucomicrobiae bacterium]|nr:MBOAT family O-acyltransferase [Verrucomicrobiae bacterium]
MGLDTSIFLLFLGCVAVIQSRLPERERVVLLLYASLVFYALSSVSYLVLLLVLCGLNYWSVLSLKGNPDPRRRTWIFAGTITANLVVLIGFKYASGWLGQMSSRLGWAAQNGEAMRFAVPLGLSYLTFQMLACVTDAYRQTWQIKEGFARFALFGFFFPQITSGPIPRAAGLLPQLDGGGCPTVEDRLAGLRLITYGFFKKYVVASRLSEYVTAIFNDPPAGNSMPALMAACFNALQLYADFSGYVDIAIGSARFLGIRLDPNFDRPYASTSVTEFWRRWHMSLSFWLRDYLYMPLVIRIRGFGRAGIALALIGTFAICGIWHGATWPFLLFGVAQGVALSVEFLSKSWRNKQLKKAPKQLVTWAGSIYTLGFFVLGQVMFRSTDLLQAGAVYSRLFHPRLSGGLNEFLGTRPYLFLLNCAAIAAWIGVAYIYRRTSDRATPWFLALCASLILFLGCLGSAHFIYAAF